MRGQVVYKLIRRHQRDVHVIALAGFTSLNTIRSGGSLGSSADPSRTFRSLSIKLSRLTDHVPIPSSDVMEILVRRRQQPVAPRKQGHWSITRATQLHAIRPATATLSTSEAGLAIAMVPARRLRTIGISMRTNTAASSHMMPNIGNPKRDLGASVAVASSRVMNGSTMARPTIAANRNRSPILFTRTLSLMIPSDVPAKVLSTRPNNPAFGCFGSLQRSLNVCFIDSPNCSRNGVG